MRSLLEAAGYKVVKIPEETEPRGDFRVSIQGEAFVVEVKDKEDSKYYKALLQELRGNGVAVGGAPLKPDNVISGVIRHAASQLGRTPCSDHDFRLIWFSCLGMDDEYVLTQAELTLYGRRDVIPFIKGVPGPEVKQCYFFEFNEFFRCPQVDGAILFGKNIGWALCLNSFSTRHEALKRTHLFSLFGEAVRDPHASESRREAFTVEGDIDRKDKAAVEAHLCHKYGLDRLVVLNPAQFQAIAPVPRKVP